MTILAWHFVHKTLRNGDPIPPDGEWLEFDGEPIICARGLHASRRLIDALQYAPGSTICRVECDRIWDEHDDKFVCSRRRILWRLDAKDTLRAFARLCALDVAHLWDMPDVVRDFLESGDESLRAAASAAARDAASAAASAAAWAAASAAAWVAARDAASAAARDAARDAAWDAAWAAARLKQDERLTAMVLEAAGRTE